ncbi:unnamed protein product [Aphanomyces euteiches]|uniref:Protein kinase domain-containing protein n=1 Tax=Aphanomyces euteiches TaxID=100861 RepID=A0A6G0XC97_9STRA|nr:hypothetical protein Ae201684_006740 [Aphanomyces euteiches]KAH9091225.1 hypothetical protein Ae201684P_006625 [Aphanomyces euteiches]KAH9133317.1 hypothetical protein AeRB84_020579 [Aphanomyces euteiches]
MGNAESSPPTTTKLSSRVRLLTAYTNQRKSRNRSAVLELPSVFTPEGFQIRHVEKLDLDDDMYPMHRHVSYSPTCSASSNESTSLSPIVQVRVGDFETLKVIGTGSMGRVLLVRKKSCGQLFAMKVVSKATTNTEQIWSERDVLGGTNHPGLVRLHWAFQNETTLFLVMEYCPGGELTTHIQQSPNGSFSEPTARFYISELVLALEHLHRHGIAYRDLKPENILLSADGHAKLVDFGLSKFGILEATSGTKTMCGSFEYLAPEVWDGEEYGTAVDWWSLGVVLFEMLTGLPPWYSENPEEFARARSTPLEIPSYVSESAAHLIRSLLIPRPSARIGSARGSSEIKEHPFFAGWSWSAASQCSIVPPINPCNSMSSILNASNFDIEFTRMSLGKRLSLEESDADFVDDFLGFNFEALSHVGCA